MDHSRFAWRLHAAVLTHKVSSEYSGRRLSKLNTASLDRKVGAWMQLPGRFSMDEIFLKGHLLMSHSTWWVANSAPGGLPSCRVLLKLQSNTPEPMNQVVQECLTITGRCVEAELKVSRTVALQEQGWLSLVYVFSRDYNMVTCLCRCFASSSECDCVFVDFNSQNGICSILYIHNCHKFYLWLGLFIFLYRFLNTTSHIRALQHSSMCDLNSCRSTVLSTIRCKM